MCIGQQLLNTSRVTVAWCDFWTFNCALKWSCRDEEGAVQRHGNTAISGFNVPHT